MDDKSQEPSETPKQQGSQSPESQPVTPPEQKPAPSEPKARAPKAAAPAEEQPEEPVIPELVQTVCREIANTKPYAEFSDTPAIEVAPENLLTVLTALRDKPEFAFSLLMDHTAIDRLDDGEFELVYRLYSMQSLNMLVVFTRIPRENPVIPTVSGLWRIAEWQEREVYDLFGVLYDNHPDLRRVFLEDAWEGFPLRKDYQDDFMLTLERE